jgi:hypothetical protein
MALCAAWSAPAPSAAPRAEPAATSSCTATSSPAATSSCTAAARSSSRAAAAATEAAATPATCGAAPATGACAGVLGCSAGAAAATAARACAPRTARPAAVTDPPPSAAACPPRAARRRAAASRRCSTASGDSSFASLQRCSPPRRCPLPWHLADAAACAPAPRLPRGAPPPAEAALAAALSSRAVTPSAALSRPLPSSSCARHTPEACSAGGRAGQEGPRQPVRGAARLCDWPHARRRTCGTGSSAQGEGARLQPSRPHSPAHLRGGVGRSPGLAAQCPQRREQRLGGGGQA